MEEKKGTAGRAWILAVLSFIACILFGTGIGLLLDRPDVGAPIGVGAGFLVMGLIGARVVEPSPITISLPRSFVRVLFSIAGALIIVCGVFVLYDVELLYPWIAGISIIVVGLVFFLGGLIGTRKREESK